MREAVSKSPLKKDLKEETVRSRARYVPRTSKARKDRTKLGKVIETFLVHLIVAFSTHLIGLTKSMLISIATMFTGGGPRLTRRWLKGFMARHRSEIKARVGKQSHKRKVLIKAFGVIQEWLQEQKVVAVKEAWKPHLVFNIDETKALPSELRAQLLCTTNMTEAQYQLVQDSTLYSMVSCIAADGTTLFVLYIFRKSQAKTLQDQPIYVPEEVKYPNTRSSINYPIFFSTTPCGYMNGELWKETLKIFIRLTGRRQGLGKQDPALLYVDGCSSHLKSFTPDELCKHNITVSWFPSNTSHILQPADGAYFASYKRVLQEVIARANIIDLLQGDSLKKSSLLCSLEAERRASEPSIIRASFEKRGIFPFDEAKIMANAFEAIGTERSMDAQHELLHTLLTDVMFNDLKAYFKSEKEAKTKYIADVNKALSSVELHEKRLPKLPRAPRAKKTAKAAAAVFPETPEVSDNESDSSESDGYVSEDDGKETVWQLAPLTTKLPPSEADLERILCPGCDEPKESRHLLTACLNCNNFRLCLSCRANGNALSKHYNETNCGKVGRISRSSKAGK